MKFEGQISNLKIRKAGLNILANCIIYTPFNICHNKLQFWSSSPTAVFGTTIRQLYPLLWSPIHFAVLFLSQPRIRSTVQNTNNHTELSA